MRFLMTTFAVAAVLMTVTACNSKSSSNSSDQTTTEASAAASPADTGMGMGTESPSPAATTTAGPGDAPLYPGAVSQASGSSGNSMGTAAGQVLSTDDSFDKVYTWYQQNMPAGSEKTHVTAPVPSAVFTIGDPSKGQTSVTLSTSGGKTMITIAHVKM